DLRFTRFQNPKSKITRRSRMQDEREVVVLSGVRTPVGKYGGSLKDISPSDLGAMVTKEAIKRAGVQLDKIDQVVFGNILHTEGGDMYMGRLVALKAGLPVETPGFTVNRLCGSGLQAIISAAQYIQLGHATTAV